MSLIITKAQLDAIVLNAGNNAGVVIHKRSGTSDYYAVLSYKGPYSMLYITTTSIETLEGWIDNDSYPDEIQPLTDDKDPSISGVFDAVYFGLNDMEGLMSASSAGKIIFKDENGSVPGHSGTYDGLKATAAGSSLTGIGTPFPPGW